MEIMDLSAETVELLPDRHTLAWSLHLGSNYAELAALNSSLALNAASFFAVANSVAYQPITVNQH
jgi:hypothetical protein